MNEQDKEHMRRMGDTESSVAYWTARTITWNNQPVTVREPARNWVNQEDGE